ncbi:MAG: peptidoglycan DD-metalloendopeptidase family protein [Oscillospiraceae bacterium]
MTKLKTIRLISLFMMIAVLFSIATFPASAERNFQQEIDALEKKIDKNNSNINSSKESIDALQDQIDTLQAQLNVYNEKIEVLNKQISEKDALIKQKEIEITSITAEIVSTNKQIEEQNITINKTYDILKDRLRAAYMAGETSTLEVLLSSTDFEGFLTRLELVSSVSKYDTGLVKGLQEKIAELKNMNDELTAKKADLDDKKIQVEKEKAEIVKSRSEVQSTYDVLDRKQNDMQQNVYNKNSAIEKLNRSSAEFERIIAKIEEEERIQFEKDKNSGSTGDGSLAPSDGNHGFKVSSKGMISPLQGNTYISSGFGGGRGHLGIDLCISGLTYGKPIYAAASGTVIKAIRGNSSYGNYVMIDHGNGVTTKYAHALSLNVSTGQKVSQGQQIAVAGNTGNVIPGPTSSNPYAGSHLHFEVAINGNVVNPVNYLP